MDLILRENNLYRNGVLIEFEGTDEVLLSRDLLDIEGTLQDSYHTVLESDRLDLIAYKYYKNKVSDSSKYWWVIADANAIYNPLDLSELVGEEILIPNILNTKLKIS